MNDTSIKRWGAYALGAAGLTNALFWVLALVMGGFEGADKYLDPLLVPAQALHVLAAIFAIWGIVGIYFDQRANLGGFGLAAAWIAVLGASLYLVDGFTALAFFPIIARAAPELLDAGGALIATPWYIVMFATHMTGYILLTLVLLIKGTLQKGAVILLLAGAIAFNLPPVVPFAILAAGGVVWGVGAIWLALALANQPLEQAASAG